MMADLDKVLKGLECCDKKYPRNAWCKYCPYEPDCYHDSTCDLLIHDALKLLKQYSGLTKALEQSNAVNEHLNVEIERLTKTEEQKKAERKQKRREWQARYREAHRQQAYQTTKEWRKNNPDKVKAQRARHRERQRMRKDGDGE